MSKAVAEVTLAPDHAEAIRDAAIHSLGTTRWLTSKAIAGLTPEQWIFQTAPEVNHILWNVGHIATSESSFLPMTGGTSRAVPAGYKDLFGTGSEPKPSLDAYPDPDEVVDVFNNARQELIGHFKGLSGAQLTAPTEGDMMRQLCPTVAQILNFCVLHEATHAGQILVARRALGLPRYIG